MSEYMRFYWTCPFYKSNGKGFVSCEGGRIRMPSDTYFREYCADPDSWRRCTVARALLREYEAQERSEEESQQLCCCRAV